MLLADDDDASLKKSELINWYLKEIESEIDSEEELISKKNIIEKVIHRLIHYVRMLLFNLTQIVRGQNAMLSSLNEGYDMNVPDKMLLM